MATALYGASRRCAGAPIDEFTRSSQSVPSGLQLIRGVLVRLLYG